MKICLSMLSALKGYHVCVVGAGPAGFYAAMHITKHLGNVSVDLIDKLPVPFGLVRYGVAPDHPEVKNVINQFTKVAQKPNVNFYGNLTLGKDLHLSQLRQHYDAVLLTYGAEEDKVLGIENETVENVIAARKFVGWYNGLPSCTDLKIDLSGHTAAIFGQGNVALDVARILLSPIDVLRKTDITDYALNVIAESKIKELYLIGRRGPLQVAFTIKELREQLKLKNCRTIWRECDFKNVNDIVPNLQRPRKRLTELMLKSLKESVTSDALLKTDKIFKPIFFRSPHKILVQDNKVKGVSLMVNKLSGSDLETMKCVSTNDIEDLDCDLIFRSIGYKSTSADKDLVLKDGYILNQNGRVKDDKENKNFAKLYVAGWLGTGPTGVILHTMGNAFQVAKTICEDLKTLQVSPKGGFEEIKQIINSDHIVDWNGWQKIDKYEIEQGKNVGKPREKICSIKKMIAIAKN